MEPTLRQPEQCQPRLHGVPTFACFAVARLGSGELASQPEQLTLLVQRHAQHWVAGRVGQVLTGLSHLVHGVVPVAAQLHDLRRVHQALTAIRLEVLLIGAPAAQHRRPLLHATHVEDRTAADDHGAVDDSSYERRDLAVLTATIASSSIAMPRPT